VLGLALLAVGAVALTAAARADDPDQQAGAGPQANVARLSYVDGKVQISQGGQVFADQAPLNAPLVAGVTVTTGQDGQAEIEFQDGSVARISPNSALTLATIPGPNGQGELVLESGLGYFEFENGAVKVRFADSTATVAGSTVFRVDVDNPPGNLAVFSGNVHVARGDALALDLHGGESVALGAGDASQYNISETIEPDSWDAWNSDRDQALSAESTEQTAATSSVPQGDTPAWNDLSANGNWYDVPGEGTIWSPYEAADAGWDPYGCGSWVWTPGYGYVWASCESWGFLPYQGGMWNYYDGFGWGWSPGVIGRGRWFGGYPGVHILHGPGGYRPVVRPNPRAPGGHYPHPPVAINRHAFASDEQLPSRDRNAPVQIAGATVMPMRTVGFRQGYNNGGGSGFVNHATPAYSSFMQSRTASGIVRGTLPADATQRPAYTPPVTAYRNSASPNNSVPGHPTYTPPNRPYTYTPPSRAPAYTPSRSYNPPSEPRGGFSPPPSRGPSGGGGGGGGGFHGGGGGPHH
jgi:hypothetical protein